MFCTVFDNQKSYYAKEKYIYDAVGPERNIIGPKCLRRHEYNANPHADRPRQAEILGTLSFNQFYDERDIKKWERDP